VKRAYGRITLHGGKKEWIIDRERYLLFVLKTHLVVLGEDGDDAILAEVTHVDLMAVEDAQDVVEEPHMLLEIPPPSEDLVRYLHVLEHPDEGFHVMQVVAKQRNMLQITFLFPIFENATIET
jgi:hypothetical protein